MRIFNHLQQIFLLIFFLYGCGPSQEDYDKLASSVEELESKLDECQNGSSRRINEIKNAYQNKNYDLALSATEELMKHHPGSLESKEAEKIVGDIKLILEKQEIIAKKEAERKNFKG